MSRERVVTWNPVHDAGLQLGRSVVSIGVFDGLHLGHRALLAQARAEAEKAGAHLLVVTFAADPDEFFAAAGASFDKLLSDEHRLELLAQVSQGTVVVLPAEREVFQLEPTAFLDALARLCEPVGIVVGADFRFGARAAGTVDDIERWCAGHGCSCQPVGLLEALGAPVTATRIRGLLGDGGVETARELCAGRAHSVEGTVVHGRGEGTGFGFATANLSFGPEQPMLPREGVYGGYARVRGVSYAAAINVGVARSFEGATSPLEAHLLDFTGDLYGERVEVSFLTWLREPRVFESQQELVETVTGNIDWVRENLGGGLHGAH